MDRVAWFSHEAMQFVAGFCRCYVMQCEVRPWKNLVPKIMTLDNAYRPRKNEEDKVPHSFVFRRREGCSAFNN